MDKEGKGLVEATLDAVRMRLRPILMTSLAFILGVMPLVISSGAGSGAQNAVGTGVMGGMVTATVLAIFFVPVFFVVVRRRFSRKNEDIEHSHQLSIIDTFLKIRPRKRPFSGKNHKKRLLRFRLFSLV